MEREKKKRKYIYIIVILILISGATYKLHRRYINMPHETKKYYRKVDVYDFAGNYEQANIIRKPLDQLEMGNLVYARYDSGTNDFVPAIVLGSFGDEVTIEPGEIYVNGEVVFESSLIDEQFISENSQFKSCYEENLDGKMVKMQGVCRSAVLYNLDGSLRLTNYIKGENQFGPIVNTLYVRDDK